MVWVAMVVVGAFRAKVWVATIAWCARGFWRTIGGGPGGAGFHRAKQLHYDHVDYHFGVVVGCKPCEDTDECNGHRCYR